MISDFLDRIGVGDRHGSRSRTITETDIVTFSMFSGDWHPLHTDVEFAAADPRFGQRIAHGALVLSVALGLVEFRPDAMKAFYGIDRLRFVSPTVIGDTVRVETEVVAVEPKGTDRGVVTCSFVVRNQDDAVVIDATLKALVVREGVA
ncbi:Aldehyde dehydrogenase [Pseudonocardia sp. Ae168_Ps1]|uniref:MaoC/PaaZ C-terminal domain-containing protein n=1 Tax=unclassified Pseudonocardia TaxID=2619320 RepID=UPI0001FFE381|nr:MULTISPECIES: MaoC/PaaZ C-terminal domain-containing protein [unclassified Pseudonocardia]OLL75921.1 Aldehyde dehydrogenase [Pseudonocardia sp. Ae150A_Ps1]OLL81920.1 Aldehyde dehydrogenase [Pseudonocardia sp. Ae168_Ps1]OLL83967.1 Aldehyde dehydrogenase [Pseudonocardia sp. Ae263_Ps1]OLL96013.1 Aldehyde dehydrogenase [Pseudonocardia sp. Ae356_Ps1]OLM16704.1 Aldehyde dehydrogenase [Pseudonocardia sp. Ae707_Ps1]